MDDRQVQTLLDIGSAVLILVLVGSFIAVIRAALGA
jgi:hypothetical protein